MRFVVDRNVVMRLITVVIFEAFKILNSLRLFSRKYQML